MKSFLSSLLFFSVSKYRFQERCVLIVGNAVVAEKVVVDENQIQTADDKCCYAIERIAFFPADVGIAYNFQCEREQTLRCLFNTFAQLWVAV